MLCAVYDRPQKSYLFYTEITKYERMVCIKCEKKEREALQKELAKGSTSGKPSSSNIGLGSKVKRINENKLLSAKSKNAFSPYANTCKTCKGRITQKGGNYCQTCAYKNGICAICGSSVLDTKFYRQTSK